MWKNRLCYFFIVVLFAWLMIMYDGVAVESMFVSAIVLPIILIIIKHIIRLAIKCRWNADNIRITAGESVNIISSVKNHSILPVNRIEIKFQIEDMSGETRHCKMVTNMMPLSSIKCAFEVNPKYAGAITVTLQDIRIYDYFGLTSTKKKIGSVLKVGVYPKTRVEVEVLEPTEHLAVEEADAHSDQFPGQDKAEIFDIAEYHDGDNVKDVHWKLSMKTDKMMVKKFSQPVSSETNIYLDFAMEKGIRLSPEGIDHFFAKVFSLINELKNSGEAIRIFAFDAELNSIYQIYEDDILVMDYTSPADADQMLQIYRRAGIPGRNILITNRINSGEEDVIFVPVKKRAGDDKKEITGFGSEMMLHTDERKMGLYTRFLRMVIIFMGSFVPVAICLDVIIYDENFTWLLVYGAVATIGIALSGLFKNRAVRWLYIIALLTITILFTGIGNIVDGVRALGNIAGAGLEIEKTADGYYQFGMLKGDGEEITRLFGLITFVLALIFYVYTWHGISMLVHVVLTVPFVIVSFFFGVVPKDSLMVMFMVYFMIMVAYALTYGNIVRNEKGIYKKAFYDSTLNVGAICGYIAGYLVMLIMVIDMLKGYDRSQWLTDTKNKINSYIDDIDIKDMFREDVVGSGGVNNGKLGQVDRLEFTGGKQLAVTIEGNVDFPIYLKSFVGTNYVGNAWEIIYDEQNDIIKETLDEYMQCTLYDAYMLQYNILKLGAINIPGADITQLIKKADYTIEKTNTSDGNVYVPYNSSLDEVYFIKDGVLMYQPWDVISGNMLQLNSKYYDLISKKDEYLEAGLNKYRYVSQIYNSVAKVIYTAGYYYGDYYDRIKDELPQQVIVDGNKINLTDGVSVNGYLPYIKAVQNYLKENYTYSLSPGHLKTNQDFMDKFMEDGKGYCTSFATMATLMFRMYGIPARYVEGYYVSAGNIESYMYNENGEITISVLDNNAHAWTEIYVEGLGWVPIETTPGFVSEESYSVQDRPQDSSLEEQTSEEKQDTTPMNDESTGKEETSSEDTLKQSDTSSGGSGDNKTSGIDSNPESENTTSFVFKKHWLFLIMIAAAIGAFIGRKNYKYRKYEELFTGAEYNRAIMTWKKQLVSAMKLAGYAGSFNNLRSELAAEFALYIEEKIPEKIRDEKAFDREKYQKSFIDMFQLFDEASYSENVMTMEQRDAAGTMANETMVYIYASLGWAKRFYMKYIKCLYLKEK